MPERDSPKHRRERAVLEALDDTEPITIPELAAILESHPATVERWCIELQRAGRIRQCTGGKLTRSDTDATSQVVGD